MTHPTRVFDLLQYQKTKTPLQNIFSSKIDNKWVGISTEQFIQKVDDVSKGLIALGIQPNEKVGLISENRLEWNILDFAIQQIGAVVVAIYPNISNSDYEFILNDAEVRYCFVSNDQLYQRLLSIHDKIPTVQAVYTFNLYNNIPHWDTVTIGGFNIENQTLEALKAQVSEKDLATLIYTSGTTGKPKGVMLSHENLLSDVTSSEYSFPVQAYDKALTFLPACHAYERVFHYVYIKMGLPIFYARSMDTIGEDIQEVKPQIFSAVPRVLEKVYEKIMQTGSQLSGIKRMIFFWALSVGKKYDLDESKFSFWYATQLKFARKLVFSKWQQALGGEIKGIASGSATLPTQLLKLYLAAGIQIYEGYGLTEAGPCLSVNCIKRGMKIGTVGLPLINIEIKLAPDGEILARGRNIMLGYYKNPEETAQVLKDGWLHTGDIGQWDGNFLKIIDRKKELFKTSGGKYIVPQQLEAKFAESPYIEQIMVIGEGQKFPGALIVPHFGNINNWLKQQNKQPLSNQELVENPLVKQKIEEEIQKINPHFGNWEQIKRFELLAQTWSIETGELTPTLKLKRKVISEKYKDLIANLYSH